MVAMSAGPRRAYVRTMASTGTDETFQIPIEVAETYERDFVPALFAEWAPVTLDGVSLEAGQRLLDLACGTGIVGRTALGRWGDRIAVTGLDLNPAMLTVADRVEPRIEWVEGDVADLPLEADSFDAAVCQMAFMFFPDRRCALAEMARVVRPEGRMAVLVPAALDAQPAYEPFVDVAVGHSGDDARAMLGTYWNCGDDRAFTALATEAGWAGAAASTTVGVAHFASIEAFVDTELDATPLGERISEEARAEIVTDLRPQLSQYLVDQAGKEGLTLPFACHLMTGTA